MIELHRGVKPYCLIDSVPAEERFLQPAHIGGQLLHLPEEASPYVKVMATGRSDYANQVNNALCFPGIFRSALDARAREINSEMKLAAAQTIASAVGKNELHEEYIIPSIFNRGVVRAVAREVARATKRTGVARRTRTSHHAGY